jgi:hypothetical protein
MGGHCLAAATGSQLIDHAACLQYIPLPYARARASAVCRLSHMMQHFPTCLSVCCAAAGAQPVVRVDMGDLVGARTCGEQPQHNVYSIVQSLEQPLDASPRPLLLSNATYHLT